VRLFAFENPFTAFFIFNHVFPRYFYCDNWEISLLLYDLLPYFDKFVDKTNVFIIISLTYGKIGGII